MAKMSNEMIVGMIQQRLDCLQRFVKADELSVLDLEFMVHHAWEIERASALFIYEEIVWNTLLRNL